MFVNLNTRWVPGAKWPPHCCVAAFVHAALIEHSIPFEAPAALPSLLGIRVDEGDYNPLMLPIAPPGYVSGLTAAEASLTINKLFRELNLEISYRHIPLNEVMLGLTEDVLSSALQRRLVVGLGVNYSHFYCSRAMADALHVFRVTSFTGNRVILFDDSRELDPPTFGKPWREAELASLAISDGLWLIGKVEDLQLPHTMPLH